MDEVRLQKFLAEAGINSRRKCEEYISQGRVKVNGKVIKEQGTKVNPIIDIIEFDGKKVLQEKNKKYTYILLNKPIDYVTTVRDQFNRKTVLDLIKLDQRLVPVGRLDMYTSGALILTDDGNFVYKITHPKYEIEKTYTVTLIGIPTEEEIKMLREGVDIDGYKTSKAQVRMIKKDEEENKSRLEITIHEGKNKEVRKMCEKINKKVIALHRTKIGNISVKGLRIGDWRYLTKKEIDNLIK